MITKWSTYNFEIVIEFLKVDFNTVVLHYLFWLIAFVNIHSIWIRLKNVLIHRKRIQLPRLLGQGNGDLFKLTATKKSVSASSIPLSFSFQHCDSLGPSIDLLAALLKFIASSSD